MELYKANAEVEDLQIEVSKLSMKKGAEEATKDLVVQMMNLCQSIFQEGWRGALIVAKVEKSSDVWGMCHNCFDTTEDGTVDSEKVAANDEHKRKLAEEPVAKNPSLLSIF